MDDGTSAGQVSSTGASLAEQIFAGTGEMARLIRQAEWSGTPLGPIDGWPQSLRTAVSICLGSRHRIVLWWGPERWMFYNDAYRPMLGERKHPQFLSPIRDDTGRPSGIFNACSETTGRVLAERRMKMLREMAVEARTIDEAVRLCAEILGRNLRDIPFALVYLLDDSGKTMHLAAHVGLEPGTPASPLAVDTDEQDSAGWPLAVIARQARAELVDDLAARFDCLSREPWDEAPHQAMIWPIARPGWPHPAGVLVLGINPRRAFDEDYRSFFDLVAGHVATAVSNARTYEEERTRAEKLAELDRVKTAFFSNISHESFARRSP